jgi:septum formation protein
VLPLHLASASPRRRELLASLGVAFTVTPSDTVEDAVAGESPRDHAVRLAARKGAAVAGRLAREGVDAIVLAADTIVTIDGDVLGKPDDAMDALAMLRRLAGRTHEVITACRLIRCGDGRAAADVAVSSVRFAPWDEERARWYVSTGEPMDKAGAYGIQGRGVFLATGIDGSWSNVVGLPLEILPALFREIGDDLLRRVEGCGGG